MEYIVVVGCRHCVTTYIPHTRLDYVLNHRIISGPQQRFLLASQSQNILWFCSRMHTELLTF